MESALQGKLFDYGVWRAPFLIEGFPALMAVDSFGVIRKVRRIRPLDDAEELAERLFAWLTEHHPQRKLELVRDTVKTSAKPPTDPQLLADPRSPLAKRRYLDGLVKNAARRAAGLPRPHDH